MMWLVIPGLVLTVGGLGLLVFCIARAMQIRKDRGIDEDARRQALRGLVAVNFGGVALSAFGLIVATVGFLL